MLASNTPPNFPIAFASSAGGAYIRPIPSVSQIGITDGAASLPDGFPPLNFIDTGAGGVPMWGEDLNGILNEITANLRWLHAGGVPLYDAPFSTSIGGYPNNAVVRSDSGHGFWRSTIDNNGSNPNTGGINWVPFSYAGTVSISVTGADVTLTAEQAAHPIIVVSGAMTADRSLLFPTTIGQWIVVNATTGGHNLHCKTSGGSNNVNSSGGYFQCWCDGTNIYPTLSNVPNDLHIDGSVTSGGAVIPGANNGAIQGSMSRDAGAGLVMRGIPGVSFDWGVLNAAGTQWVMYNPTGTYNLIMPGTLSASGFYGPLHGNADTCTTAANGGVTSVNGMVGAVNMGSFNYIGSYALATYPGGAATGAGGTRPGSVLSSTDCFGNAPTYNMSGTWMCMGYCGGSGTPPGLWLRIA